VTSGASSVTYLGHPQPLHLVGLGLVLRGAVNLLRGTQTI